MSIAIGQPIPPCEVPATSQLTFSPLAAQGKKLVLYFYPKDMTPGCTAESGEFRDHIDAFTKANTLVIGVSRDTLPIGVHPSEPGLRISIPLPSSGSKPFHGFDSAFRNTLALCVHHSEVPARFRIALRS
jgi:hypothetical protein